MEQLIKRILELAKEYYKEEGGGHIDENRKNIKNQNRRSKNV